MVARSCGTDIQFDGSFIVRVVSTNLAHIQAKFIVMELVEWKEPAKCSSFTWVYKVPLFI